MIAPKDALELVREQLRTAVLERLDRESDEYAKSVLIAALGVLREMANRVSAADNWCAASVDKLRASATGWPSRLAPLPECSAQVEHFLAQADAAHSLAEKRSYLLEAAETVISTLWRTDPAQRDAALLGEIRELLTFDTAAEVDYAAHGSRA